MPRSGTTLTEQIISAHEDVHGAGELNYMTEAIESFSRNKENKNLRLWEIFKDIKQVSFEDLKKMQTEYSKKLKLHDLKNKIITDKAPLNFRWIGFIKMIFPNSKIIHCNRNPMDICFSRIAIKILHCPSIFTEITRVFFRFSSFFIFSFFLFDFPI